MNFERSEEVLKYLDIKAEESNIGDIKRLNQMEGLLKKFNDDFINDVYNEFYSYYSGFKYKYFLKTSSLYHSVLGFIDESHKQLKNESFRQFILALCQFEYEKKNDTIKNYYNIFTIDRKRGDWPAKIPLINSIIDFTIFSNLQLVMIYQNILVLTPNDESDLKRSGEKLDEEYEKKQLPRLKTRSKNLVLRLELKAFNK